jgi:hypothetical protein
MPLDPLNAGGERKAAEVQVRAVNQHILPKIGPPEEKQRERKTCDRMESGTCRA